jgi:hypothetical protein
MKVRSLKVMRTQRKWQCPYCTGVRMASSRHWNVVRHIKLIHRHYGQPVDYLTKLTRYQVHDRVRMYNVHGYRQANLKHHHVGKQLGQKPHQYSDNNDINEEHNRDKKFWELADKSIYLKELEVIMEIQRNSVHIIQQNNLISLLRQIMHP